jgi:hypothetical protein
MGLLSHKWTVINWNVTKWLMDLIYFLLQLYPETEKLAAFAFVFDLLPMICALLYIRMIDSQSTVLRFWLPILRQNFIKTFETETSKYSLSPRCWQCNRLKRNLCQILSHSLAQETSLNWWNILFLTQYPWNNSGVESPQKIIFSYKSKTFCLHSEVNSLINNRPNYSFPRHKM